MKPCLLSLLFSLIGFPLFAATIKGNITDTKGTPLPFAIVFVKGSTIGTSANAEGAYQLTLPEGTYHLVCQYMGFKQSNWNFSVSENQTVTHHFSLQEETLALKEHVVKATEDPALYIMHKVIARRKFHLEQIRSFQTEIYLKGIFKTRETPKKILGVEVEMDATAIGLDSNGQGILYLCEQNATYTSQKGKEKTVIHSVRENGNANGLGFSTFPPVINFYENNIPIGNQITPRGLISPVSDGALGYYNYKLLGDFTENGHTIFKIAVTPKRTFEPLMSGTLYIVDNEWGIHSLNMTATKTSNIQVLDTLRFTQAFLPVRKDEWVIKQQAIFLTVKILGFDIVGNFITVYDNQQINLQIAEDKFSGKIISEYEKGANKKDSSYWAANRPIPLEEEELRDHLKKDSIRKVYEDPAFKDSLRRRGNKFQPTDFVLGGYHYTGKEEKLVIQTNGILSGLINYNTVEGWNTAPKIFTDIQIDSFKKLSLVTAARYGFSNRHFNGIGRIDYRFNNKEWQGRYWILGFEGGKYIFQYNPYNPIAPLFNSISSLLYRKNYLKIYERWNAILHAERNFGNGLKMVGQLGFQQRIPLQNTTDYTYAQSDVGGFTENFPSELKTYLWEKHNAVIAKVSASYQPGYRYVKYPDYLMPIGSSAPVFTLSYEKGFSGILNSKTNFDKWRFSIKDHLNLRLLGDAGYHIIAGGFLRSKYTSIPDLNHLQGNQLSIASSYLESFQIAPYYAFSNDADLYGEGHIEWKLQGFLTNKIPLFRNLNWYLVTGTNAYYVNQDFYHTEVFVGLDNIGWSIYRFLRIDYVHGWNSLHQKLSAIRLGFNSSLFSISTRQSRTEW